MIKVNCIVKDCKSVFESNDVPSSEGVRYICSHHSDEELRQSGIHTTIRMDRDIRFQDFSFDRDLKSAKTNRGYTKPLPLTPELPTSSILVVSDTAEYEALADGFTPVDGAEEIGFNTGTSLEEEK